jgi:regulator of cell morphogenesis and NO signaling
MENFQMATAPSLAELTLSEIVTNDFHAAAVFEKYNLDFCCKGKRPLSEACSEKNIDLNSLLEELESYTPQNNNSDLRYNEWKIDFLADYIVNNHHSYVRRMIPILAAHTQKIASVHGENHPETVEVAKRFAVVYKDLKQHMMKEEQILFPYVKQLLKFQNEITIKERPFFGAAENPIKAMEAEHEAAGDELFEIRSLTNNYTPPADACNTYRICYQELKEFEEDLHKHVHLENNILFPKTIKLEKEIFG